MHQGRGSCNGAEIHYQQCCDMTRLLATAACVMKPLMTVRSVGGVCLKERRCWSVGFSSLFVKSNETL